MAGRLSYWRIGVAEAYRIGTRVVLERCWAVVALWGMAAVVIAAYFFVPGVPSLLEPVGRWRHDHGCVASFALCAVFCGLIPYFIYLVRQCPGCRSVHFTAFAQTVWCGLCGVVCGWFFSLQARWFGDGHDVLTVATKVIVDQFGWSVLVMVPANAAFYAVLSGGWRIGHERVPLRVFIFRVYLPMLLMNWAAGIPSNCAVYSFPEDLQIPVLGLMSSAWSVISVGLGAHSGRAIRASSCP